MFKFRLFISVGLTLVLTTLLGWFWNPTHYQAPTITHPLLTNNVAESKAAEPVLIAVAPHHNLVASQRQAFFKQLATQAQPETIILLSPNHFDLGTANVLTTDRTWDLHDQQNILPNITVIQALKDSGVARLEDGVFSGEHGIKNMLADIHAYFPDATLVPVIFKSGITHAEEQATLDEFLAACPDCGLIASVDMSHYQPAQEADLHDVKTLRSLDNLDEDETWTVEVDSNASLVFLEQWAKTHNQNRFTLFDHTNSGFLANNLDIETTTHIFGAYTTGSQQISQHSFTFTVAGDAMFGRFIQNYQNDYTQLFTQLGNRTFWGTDISWLNLEGPVSDQPVVQITEDDPLVFNFPQEAISALTYLKLTTVGLANNHTFNQGQAGLDTTRQLLSATHIDTFGDPSVVSTALSVKRYEAGGLKVSLIGLSQFGNLNGAEQLITAEKQAGQFVIVYVHWGLEYQTTHSLGQELLATSWASAGADLIIGAHPHVVQDAQLIGHTPVFYSLGNFIFDQTFSTDTQQGLILSGEITDTQIKIDLLPTVSHLGKPQIAQGEIKQQLVGRVCQNLGSTCIHGEVTVTR